jgi:hypothetical protein
VYLVDFFSSVEAQIMNRLLSSITFGLLTLLLALPMTPAADPPKDTSAAAFTRTKKLKGKITVDFKNEMLKEIFKEISGQLEDAKLGALSVHYGTGISGNTKVSYAGKDVTVETAIDEILKQLDLGYIVVSKEKDRYDGWLEIVKGTERGYPAGTTTPAKSDAKKVEPKKVEPKKEEMKKEEAKKVEPKKEEMKKEEPKKEEMKKEEAKKEEPKKEEAKTEEKKVTEEDEKQATSKLDLAKKLQTEGKIDRAKVQLKFIVKHYNGTKAAVEAKELLEKLEK